MSEDSWYFGYGSNLWKDQKAQRTGPIRQGNEGPRIAQFKNHRLAFNKSGKGGEVYANIVPCEGEKVVGVIYRWSKEAREKMAGREIGYVEQMVEVTTDEGEMVMAVTFVADASNVCGESRPSRDYLRKIVKGAKQHGLPEEYISRVERLAEAGNWSER